MKRFSFPLDRVLSWRQTQTRLEEAALARLTAARQALDHRAAALRQSLADAQTATVALPAASPVELAALEHYRASVAAQSHGLAKERQSLESQIARQTEVLQERRRSALLLERLRERRRTAWSRALVREIDQLAEESHLARLSRDLHRDLQLSRRPTEIR